MSSDEADEELLRAAGQADMAAVRAALDAGANAQCKAFVRRGGHAAPYRSVPRADAPPRDRPARRRRCTRRQRRAPWRFAGSCLTGVPTSTRARMCVTLPAPALRRSDQRTQAESTPLFNALSTGKAECAKMLLDRGADIKARTIVRAPQPCDAGQLSAPLAAARPTQGNETVLHVAIDSVPCLKMLLDHGSKDLETCDGVRARPAPHARASRWRLALSARWSCVRRADSAPRCQDGFTVFLHAAAQDKMEVVVFLLSRGANKKAVVRSGVQERCCSALTSARGRPCRCSRALTIPRRIWRSGTTTWA